MNIYTSIGLIMLTAVAAFTLRDINRTAAVNIAIAGGAVVMLNVIAAFSGITDEVKLIAVSGDLDIDLIGIILKAIGISYMAHVASELCRDMDENALAAKAEIVGRVMLLSLALPIVRSIAESLIELVKLSV